MEEDPYAVLAVTVPEELFREDDEYCLSVGTHIAQELGPHLEKSGHAIPEWVKGGCREDASASVYLESEKSGIRYGFTIVFFARDALDTRTMAIQYEIKQSFFKRCWQGRTTLAHDDPIHDVLKDYGARYDQSELLTRSRFESQY